MSKPSPTFRHPLYQLVVYNFRYHSYIPCTYTTKIFHSRRKQKMVLKWASQLITQIWRLVYEQWLHSSKLKHARESLDGHAKEIILDDDIIDER